MKQRNTNQLLKTSKNYKFHLLSQEELKGVFVSTISKWNDIVWEFDPVSREAVQKFRINWNIGLGENGCLTDPCHSELLDYFKRLVWSLFTDRRGGRLLKIASAGRIASGMMRLLPWMAANKITSMSMMTPDATDDFLDDLVKSIAEEDEDDEVTEGKVGAPVWLLSQAWKQSEIFSGVVGSPEKDPLRGVTANSLEVGLATKVRGWIPPVPDLVAAAILEKALWFISHPEIDSFLSFVESYVDHESRIVSRLASQSARAAARSNFILNEADNIPGFFHSHIRSVMRSARTEAYSSEDLTGALKFLFYDVATACLVIIQALTGLRSGELCSLTGEMAPDGGLPACIVKRRAKSETLDIYYIKATLTKTVDSPEKFEWVAGCSLPNSQELPLAVQAIILLQRLFKPVRAMTTYSSLWLNTSTPRGFSSFEETGKATVSALSRLQKNFVIRNVDLANLPDSDRDGTNLIPYRESGGTCLRPHQWRKTFAQWMYRYDSSLIAAISEQFKHLSLAMTEQGYIGNDPLLLEALDSARTQETVNFFYEASTGGRRVTGAFAKRIEAHIDELSKLIDRRSEKKSKGAIKRWIETNDIRIHFADHGKCLISLTPDSSKCNQVSSSNTFKNSSPNFKTRTPSLCSGCDCFAVDGQHAAFWQQRYRENSSSWIRAKRIGMEGEYKIAGLRAAQAKQILNVLDLSTSAVSVE